MSCEGTDGWGEAGDGEGEEQETEGVDRRDVGELQARSLRDEAGRASEIGADTHRLKDCSVIGASNRITTCGT